MRGELGWREGAGQEGGYGQSVTPKCDVSVREAAFSQVRCRCTGGVGGFGQRIVPRVHARCVGKQGGERCGHPKACMRVQRAEAWSVWQWGFFRAASGKVGSGASG